VDNSSKLLLKVGSALLSCENKVGRFPDSNDWCDLVLKKDVDLSDWHFNPSGRLDNSCGFAFNKNLSELSVDSLAPNTVLIFEADGPWNFAGKQEQFPGTRYRDKYFPKKERFAFIFYVDATLAKYRLYDGSVALYIKDKKTFSDWHEKGETLYSPLKWK
jgi:hypothetical protein